MFGMGFMEIFLIAVVAIIALGPEKLPTAMVDIAKFFRKFKSGLDDAKSTLDQELELEKLKQEADKYKSQLTEVQNTMNPHNLDRLIEDSVKPDLTSLDAELVETPEPKEQIKATKTESTISSEQPKPKKQKAKKEKVSFKDKKAKMKEEV